MHLVCLNFAPSAALLLCWLCWASFHWNKSSTRMLKSSADLWGLLGRYLTRGWSYSPLTQSSRANSFYNTVLLKCVWHRKAWGSRLFSILLEFGCWMSPKDAYAKDLVPGWSCWKFSMDIEHVALHGWSLYWGYILGGFMRPQLLPLFTFQQNSSVPPCASAMMCSLATNLQMWCHMTMGCNPYSFRTQTPFFPNKVFISVVSVYSVRKLKIHIPTLNKKRTEAR